MKLIELLCFLQKAYPEPSGYFKLPLVNIRAKDGKYIFVLTPTRKGMRMEIRRENFKEFEGLVTNSSFDFNTLISLVMELINELLSPIIEMEADERSPADGTQRQGPGMEVQPDQQVQLCTLAV